MSSVGGTSHVVVSAKADGKRPLHGLTMQAHMSDTLSAPAMMRTANNLRTGAVASFEPPKGGKGGKDKKIPGGPKHRGKAFWASAIGGAAAGSYALPADAIRLWPMPIGGSGDPKKVATEDGVKRVLVMMSDTGGGHRASAEALSGAFEELYGGKFKVYIVDMWKHHTRWPVCTFGDSYNFMVKHPWMWRFQFRATEPGFVNKPLLGAASAYTRKEMGAAFEKYRPHLVVSVHPLLQNIPLDVIRARVKAKLMPPTPFATVVTDLTECHPTWFHSKVTACFVPTEVCKKQALSLGLKESQLVMHGLPIRPQFTVKLPPKEKLRAQLGMDTKAPTVLLVGGGE
eukprot:CAMPEP_0118934208 /NCGR_PEP_ID=MMETSP1169-20130426/13697_1 /TAXON_ID=36882 /ORGANISM="Pyramimonas obovata, Strain CCMP722" /LENGTH=341 /DNA_ID=CAMNT_0006877085 /DNA_START=146 /DNA_END=1168 /DNA_ORIENTATION=-